MSAEPEEEPFSPASTVSRLANTIRQSARVAYGEAGFARMFMEFKEEVGEANTYILYVRVIGILASIPTPKQAQLAMIWLDGAGYGTMTLEEISLEIQRIQAKPNSE